LETTSHERNQNFAGTWAAQHHFIVHSGAQGSVKETIMSSTKMVNSPNDLTVTRVETDFGATEGSNLHLYVPKGTEANLSHLWATSMQSRFDGLVRVSDEATRNLQTVLFLESGERQMRIRALRQLERNASSGNQDAANVLVQWRGSGLSLD
jgi:hypothetical protein